ncbi:hypothetical protein HOI18_02915 [Candidatus Uhrbacteria bacterium]|jgi:hypothetical protein|nr:hypothetical protein [Candidatus Uhrbacteria bacterium]
MNMRLVAMSVVALAVSLLLCKTMNKYGSQEEIWASGFIFATVAIICIVLIIFEDKQIARVAKLREACAKLLYRVDASIKMSREICEDSGNPAVERFYVRSESYQTWIKDWSENSRLRNLAGDEELAAWMTKSAALSVESVRKIRSQFIVRHDMLINTLELVLDQTALMEASRIQKLNLTRVTVRAARFALVRQVIAIAGAAFDKSGRFSQYLESHGSRAALRDVVTEDMSSIMEGKKPWRDELLRYALGQNSQGSDQASA